MRGAWEWYAVAVAGMPSASPPPAGWSLGARGANDPRMNRLLLLALLLVILAGLGWLALTPPVYRPTVVNQPVALPSASAPR